MTDEEVIEWALVGIRVSIRFEAKEKSLYDANPARLQDLHNKQVVLEAKLTRLRTFRDDPANLETDSPLDTVN